MVTSSDAVGRLMGLSSISPDLGQVIEDLLSTGEGLEVIQRQVEASEVGKLPGELPGEKVLAVVRHRTMRRFYEPGVDALQTGDQIVVVRQAVKQRTPRVE